jgi:hypothetical protein
MKLPNAEHALIAEEKLAGYLLDLGHRRGGGKAKLLHSLGYEARNWQKLAEDIRQQHLSEDVIETRESAWGIRYDIVAPLIGPSGSTVMFRSVWQFDLGSNHPRLITMYPE